MLQGLFNMDNPFWRFMGLLADLVLLNILFVICSIPIVTIGASTTALYTVSLKLAKKQEGYIASTFFKAFKSNFKQSTVIWLIMLVIGILLGLDVYIINALNVPGERVITYILIFICGIYAMALLYVFPLQCKFVNPVKQTMKNAVLLSIGHFFPQTLLILLFHAVPLFLIWLDIAYGMFFFTVYVMPLMLVMGCAVLAYLCSKQFQKVFAKYIPENPEDEYEMLSDNYITEVINKRNKEDNIQENDEENTLPQ